MADKNEPVVNEFNPEQELKNLHASELKWIGPQYGYEKVCNLCGEVYPCSTIRSME